MHGQGMAGRVRRVPDLPHGRANQVGERVVRVSQAGRVEADDRAHAVVARVVDQLAPADEPDVQVERGADGLCGVVHVDEVLRCGRASLDLRLPLLVGGRSGRVEIGTHDQPVRIVVRDAPRLVLRGADQRHAGQDDVGGKGCEERTFDVQSVLEE